MLKLMFRLASEHDSLLVGFSIFVTLSAAVLYIRRSSRADLILRQYASILNNMSQGICMFDREKLLVFCNNRCLEMYDIQHERVGPGTTLDEIVDLRYKAGSNPKMSKQEYAKWRADINASDKVSGTIVELTNGHITEIRHQPLAEGGYVATHEDITTRQLEERQRTTTVEHEKRRIVVDDAIKSFRETVETVLQTFGEDATSLKETATLLSASSIQTSQHTEG